MVNPIFTTCDNGTFMMNPPPPSLVTFKAGRFIPEENYAKEIRFDQAPYANYDNNWTPWKLNGIIFKSWPGQSQDGKPSI